MLSFHHGEKKREAAQFVAPCILIFSLPTQFGKVSAIIATPSLLAAAGETVFSIGFR